LKKPKLVSEKKQTRWVLLDFGFSCLHF